MSSVHAATTLTWSGTAGDGKWSTGGNWTGGTPPNTTTSYNLRFPAVTNKAMNNDVGAVIVADILFTATGYSLSGLSFNYLGGGGSDITVTAGAAGNTTISVPITLSANLTATVNDAGGVLIFGAALQDSGAARTFAVTGVGTVLLSTANNYTGGTTVATGSTLIVAADKALGTTAGTTTISSGGTLAFQGNVIYSIAESLSVAGTGVSGLGVIRNISGTNSFGGTITPSAAINIGSDAGNLTLSGVISSANTVTKVGAGTVTYSVANTYTGTTTVNAGTLAYGINNAIAGGAINVNGGTLDIKTFTDSVGAVTLTSGSITGTTGVLTGTSYAVQSGTVSAILAGAVNLTKSTAGTVTITSANTYTGVTTISGGILSVSSLANGSTASNIGQAPNGVGNLVMGAGTLQYTGASVSTDHAFTLTVATTSTIEVTNAGTTLTLAGGSAANTGLLTKIGPGTLAMNGSYTHTGLTTISVGTLAGTGTFSGAVTIAGGATISPGNGGVGTLSTGPLVLNSTSTLLYDLTTTASFDKIVVTGTLTLDGDVDFSGAQPSGTYTSLITYTGALTNSTLNVRTVKGGVNAAISTATANQVNLTLGAPVTRTWTGAGANDNWTTVANWGGTAPLAGDILVFPSGTARITTNTNDYDTGTTFSSISFTGAAGGAQLNGAVGGRIITLTSGGISAANTAGTNTIAATMDIVFSNAAQTISTASGGTLAIASDIDNGGLLLTVNSAGSASFSGVLSDTGGLTKSGAGTLTLTGANTYTGVTTLSAGTTNAGIAENAGVSGPLGNSAAANPGSIVFSGGTLQYSAANQNDYSGRFSTAINQSISIDTNGQNVALASNLSSSGGTLAKLGAGTLTLTGANTYSGTTTITTGTLKIGNAGIVGSLGTGGVTNNAALIFNRTDAITVGNTISGTGSLTQAGTGSVGLTGPNTYSGTTTIAAGVLAANASAAIGDGSATNTLIFNGGTFQASAAFTSLATRSVTLTTAGVIDTNGVAVTFAGIFSGASGITKNGAGTLTLSNIANTYTGQTTINAGTLSVAKMAAGGALSSLGATVAATPILLNGTLGCTGAADSSDRLITLTGAGTIQATTGTLTLSGAINNSGNLLTFDTNTGNIAASGLISGAGGLTKSGASTLTLSNTANTYSGQTTITSGTVSVTKMAAGGAVSSLGATAAATPILLNGTLSYTGAGDSSDRLITLTGASTIRATAAGTLTLSGAINNGGGLLTFDTNTGNIAASGLISGAGGLTKSGASTLTLSNSLSTYTGQTTLSAGTVSLTKMAAGGAVSSLGATAAATPILLNGTLSYTGGNDSSDRPITLTGASTIQATAAGTLTLSGAINNGGTLLTFDTNTGNITASGVVSGAGGLTKTGASTLTLSNANSYLGQSTISAGTLSAAQLANGGSNSSFGATAAATPILLGSASAATLSYTGGTVSIDRVISINGAGGGTIQSTVAGTLTLSGSVNTGGNPLTFDTNTGNITSSGVISGAGSLTKNGASTLTLSNAANTYTGQTTVNNGTLSVATLANGAVNSSLGATAATTPIRLGSLSAATLVYTGGAVSTDRQIAINGAGGATIQNAGSGLMTLTGTVGGAGNALTLNTSGANITLSNVISGAGTTLTKVSAGTVTLSGANTYSGTTTITGGTLLVNGSQGSSAVSLNGGTLAGTGTIGGLSATVLGGTVQPGAVASKGTLNGSTANLSNAGNLTMQITGYTTPGTDFDRLNLSGALTTGGTSTLTLDLNGLSVAGTATGLVVYTGGIPATNFATVTLLNNPMNFTASLSYTATGLNVTINNPAPTLSTVAPNSAIQSETRAIVFTGTNFITGVSTVTFSNAGITVNTQSVDSPTQITVSITVSPVAVPGAGTAIVTNSGPGGGTANRPFTIVASIISIEWDTTATDSNGGTIAGTINPAVWTISGAAATLGSVHRTDTAAAGGDTLYPLNLVVKNISNVPVTLTASTPAGSAPAGWTVANAAALDKYELGVNTDASATYLSLTTGRVLTSGLAINGTQSFDLRFKAPPTTSSVSAKTITVNITATAP